MIHKASHFQYVLEDLVERPLLEKTIRYPFELCLGSKEWTPIIHCRQQNFLVDIVSIRSEV